MVLVMLQATSPLGPRQFNRSVLRAHVDSLRRSGLFEEVRADVSPGVAILLDHPGKAPAWLGGGCFDELNAAIHRRRARAGLRDFLGHVMQTSLAGTLEPIIRFVLGFLGQGPAAIFGRTDLMLSTNTRNIEMHWKATSRKSGVITVVCGEPVPEVSWIAWEGTFAWVLALTGATGSVGEARPSADARCCEIDVRWERR